MTTLTFLGAAQTVTGSKYLLETAGRRVLVDCGLFQGLKELRERNWQPLPVEPDAIDAVVLTHAHIDHSGYLPRLVSQGFKGRVFCTPGTADLCRIMLPDAGRLAEEDARDANRDGYTQHAPALPLFTEDDAYRALTHLQPVGYDRPVPVGGAGTLTFADAGHLLGSAFARFTWRPRAVPTWSSAATSGATAARCCPIPSRVETADVLLVESTYGDRTHEPDDDGARLADDHHDDDRGRRESDHPGLRDRPRRGGDLLAEAARRGAPDSHGAGLPRQPDGGRRPAALREPQQRPRPGRAVGPRPDGRVHHAAIHGRRVAAAVEGDPGLRRALHRHLGERDGDRRAGAAPPESRAAPEPRNTVLFVGYQAAGTRGRQLVEGAETVKIHGQQVPVAARIERIDSMSAHADADEIMQWLRGFTRGAADDLPRARRAACAGRAQGAHRAGARVAGPHTRHTWSR